MMKIKFIFPLILAIFIGFFSAKIVYGLYNDKNTTFYNSYFLQWGVYTDKDNMNKTLKENNVNSYIVIEEGKKYHVYVGITTNKDIASKIKKIYEDNGNNIYIKKSKITNVEFYKNLEQYDVLLNSVNKDEDILSISKVILSSYDEIVMKN